MKWERARERDRIRDGEPVAGEPPHPPIVTSSRAAAFYRRRQEQLRAEYARARRRGRAPS